MKKTVDHTYASLLASVIRARERLRTDALAVAVRGGRAALILHVPAAGHAGRSFSHYVTGFTTEAALVALVEVADRLTPARLMAHYAIAASCQRSGSRYAAVAYAMASYRSGWDSRVRGTV